MDFIHNLVDIHAHILPGLDDGPNDLAESQTLLRAMSQTGVTAVYCTPHYHHPRFPVKTQAITDAFQTLVEQLWRTNVETPMLGMGAEVRITDAFKTDIIEGTVPCLGDTSYVLLELPAMFSSTLTYDVLYELRIRGYHPIIAHPERNLTLQRNRKEVQNLLDSGALLQLSADCFQPEPVYGKRHQKKSCKLARDLLMEGKVALIASDAHNVSTRSPNLQLAYDVIARNFGSVCAEELAENAQRVWRGEPCKAIGIPDVRRRAPSQWTCGIGNNGTLQRIKVGVMSILELILTVLRGKG